MRKKSAKTIFTMVAAACGLLAVFPGLLAVIFSFLPETFITYILEGHALISELFRELIKASFTLNQYKSLLIVSPDYLYRFWNAVFITVPILIGQIAAASATAFGLLRSRKNVYRFVIPVMLFLMLLPFQITVIPNYFAIKKWNLLDTYFSLWLPGVFSPFSAFLLAKAMKRVPREIIESAEMDGAGEMKLFLMILIPNCKSVISVLSILILLDYWNQIELPLVMFSNSFRYPLSIFLSEIRENYTGVSFAAAVVFSIPVILFFLHQLMDMDDLPDMVSK